MFIPEPVEVELLSVWLRQLRDAQQTFSKAGGNLVSSPEIDWNDVRARFVAAVDTLKREAHMVSIPFSGSAADAIFRRMVTSDPPFEAVDADFRDTVIFESVTTHLLERTPSAGFFASNDGVFVRLWKARESELRAAKVTLDVKGIDELVNALETFERVRESADEKARREQREQEVMQALESQRDFVEAFLADHLQYQASSFGVWPGSVLRVELKDIGSVTIGETRDQEVGIIAEVGVNVTAFVAPTVLPYPFRIPPSSRIITAGVGTPTVVTTAVSSSGPFMPQESIYLRVVITGIARRVDGKLMLARLESARVSTIRPPG